MSKDAPSSVGGRATAPDRRRFIKRATAAALGAAAVAPVVGARAAHAAGTQPAYTDDSNTFTADQRINGGLGINRAPANALSVLGTDDDWPVFIQGRKHAAYFGHLADLKGEAADCVNIYHKGTGDGLYVDMAGGVPPGYTGAIAGNTGLNVLIPYYVDHDGTGQDGTVVNDRTRMTGLLLGTQTPNDGVRSLLIQHAGNAEAIYVQNHDPGGGAAQGSGRAFGIDDWSDKPTIQVGKYKAPLNQAMVSLQNHVPGSPVIDALRVYHSGQVRFRFQTDGTLQLGTFRDPFARAQINRDVAGIARGLALSNGDSADGSGIQLEFDREDGYQMARVQAIFDRSSTSPTNATLSFQVRSSDSLAERLRLDYRGVGFYGATPVAKPRITGSRKQNDALTSLLSALASMGLLTDASSS